MAPFRHRASIYLALALFTGSTNAGAFFTNIKNVHDGPHSSSSSSSSASLLSVYTSAAPFSTRLYFVENMPRVDDSGLSYAERSRPYRRDIFSYEDWVKHRSSERFSGRLTKLNRSGLVRALFDEIVLTTSVAIFVCTYNALLVTGFQDLTGVHHDHLLVSSFPIFSLPSQFFTLSSPALSLLLVFKTNTSYQRWDEARKNWGSCVNHCRTIMRYGYIYTKLHPSASPNNIYFHIVYFMGESL